MIDKTEEAYLLFPVRNWFSKFRVMISSLPDQTLFAFEGQAVFQDTFRRDPAGQQFRVVFFLLNLLQGVGGGVLQGGFIIQRIKYLEFHDHGGSCGILRFHDHVIPAVSAFPVGFDHMKKKASGGVQAFVSLGFLREYNIPLPPLAEQKRIVAKLEELLPLCEKLKS